MGMSLGSSLLFTWEVEVVLEVECPFWLPCFSILLKTGVERVIYLSYTCMVNDGSSEFTPCAILMLLTFWQDASLFMVFMDT